MSLHTNVLYGDLINPDTLTSLRICRKSLVAVGKLGSIDWIIEDVEASDIHKILSDRGCPDAGVVVLKPGEFIIPGFVDTHTVRFHR